MSKLPDNRMALVSCLYEQIKGEEDAKMNYTAFLSKYGDKLASKDRAVVDEVIQDEMNHAIKLLAMAKRYSGLSPSSDDLVEALNFLAGKK